jgi:soluble lytic murein transglycosylase-like protein
MLIMSITTILLLSAAAILLLRRSSKSFNVLADYIADEAHAQNVPVRIVQAIVEVESGGNADAVGAAGEIGLMQIMPATALQMGYTGLPSGLFLPSVNIHYGTKYLAWQLKRYRDLATAIAAYNSGTAVKVGGKFKNQGYVDKVLHAAMVA